MASDALMFDDVEAGDQLVADGGFTCIETGRDCEVLADECGELFVHCCGTTIDLKRPHAVTDAVYKERHYLGAQENDDGTLIGFTRSVVIA